MIANVLWGKKKIYENSFLSSFLCGFVHFLSWIDILCMYWAFASAAMRENILQIIESLLSGFCLSFVLVLLLDQTDKNIYVNFRSLYRAQL